MTALLLLCCTVAGAADFDVDGIYYNILSSEDKTVEVTSGSNEYSGAVTIPASVTYNSITYSVTSIGEWAFANCTGLTSIEIPSSVTSIGYHAFVNCWNLTSIEIPSSVTSIGEQAFTDCNGLTSIVVDEGNTTYDSRNNCNAIIETASNTLIFGFKNTIIPEGVTSIGNNAFRWCYNLTSIEIPSSVTSIGQSAFIGCYGLTSVEIPSSVTSIGEWAFANCLNLTSVVSCIAAEDLFAINTGTFLEIVNHCILYVPAGAKSTYESTSGWSDFTNIVEMSSDGSNATAIESVENEQQGEAVYYDLSGRRVENPAKGIYIVNGKKVYIK